MQIEEALQSLCCDVVVLPELCVCGYVFQNEAELSAVAEGVPDGESTARMMKLSEKYGCAVIFGLAEKTDRGIYNTAVLVDKGEYVGKYRKIHLSDFEKRLFLRGGENRVFSIAGIRVGVQICFDLWFPEMSREQVRQGVDLLCVPANFGGELTWEIAGIRAMENLTPLVLCNRVGRERTHGMDAFFLGRSSIIEASGKRVGEGKVAESDCGQADIAVPPHRGNVICRDFMAEMALHEGGRAVLWEDGGAACRPRKGEGER